MTRPPRQYRLLRHADDRAASRDPYAKPWEVWAIVLIVTTLSLLGVYSLF